MQREIRFRVWDGLRFVRVEDVTFWNSMKLTLKSEHFVLMQYTGLEDKNGQHIYEGDLLEVDGGAKPFIAEVFFEEGQFRAGVPWLDRTEEQPPLRAYVGVSFCSAVVVGNIYEQSAAAL